MVKELKENNREALKNINNKNRKRLVRTHLRIQCAIISFSKFQIDFQKTLNLKWNFDTSNYIFIMTNNIIKQINL